MLGDSGVGKSMLVQKFIKNDKKSREPKKNRSKRGALHTPIPSIAPTIGMSF